jgi:shikimate kinase
MTSPYTTGGGGTHLEARVAASCLAAILCEAPIRGLPGEFATCVKSQRAAFGDALDDIIVDGVRSNGRATQLHLQVKNKLTFTENDDEWVEVLKRAYDTFSKTGFDSTYQRIGVGLGTYNTRVEQHYQSVFNWAEHSTDARHFFERIEQGDYSHQDKRSFVATVKAVLGEYTGRALTGDELWRFLKAFVIVHYDFQSATSSRDEASVIDRLNGVLPTERRDQAKGIWDHLIAKAGEVIPAGGGATRTTLIEALKRNGFAIGPAPSFWKDIQALQRESRRALDDIKSHIHDLRLHRANAYQHVRGALTDGGRFIQIDGEPGTGKSALLKEIAEECEHAGPVLVLKDTRIHPKGWAAHAHVFGVSDDMPALLREFACAGEAILFIDGIDKITDPAVQLTVNDVLKAIANDDGLTAWRVLVTIREQNLKHLETWLDPDTLKKLPLRTVAVKALDDAELNLVAKSFPRLRPLLSQSGGPDVILKRPFF